MDGYSQLHAWVVGLLWLWVSILPGLARRLLRVCVMYSKHG